MARPSSYPVELRQRAVRMVAETKADYPSETKAAAPQLVRHGAGVSTPYSPRFRRRRRDAGHRRRQSDQDQVRGGLRQDVRGLSDPSRLRQDQRPPPPHPWRQPASQRRALSCRHRPHAVPPKDHRLRHPSHPGRTIQTRDHPLPENASWPARSTTCCRPPCRSPTPQRAPPDGCVTTLTSIGSITPWPSPRSAATRPS